MDVLLDDDRIAVTKAEAARLLSVSEKTIERMLKAKLIRRNKEYGTLVRISVQSLREWVQDGAAR